MNEANSNAIFIKNLKSLLKTNDLNYADFSKKIGVRPSTVSMWMSGRSFPRIDVLEKIAQLFNITVNDLLTDSKPQTENILHALTELTQMLEQVTPASQDEKKAKELLLNLATQQANKSIQELHQPTNTIPGSTIAAHFNGDDFTEDELDEIRQFAEFVKSKRKK